VLQQDKFFPIALTYKEEDFLKDYVLEIQMIQKIILDATTINPLIEVEETT